MSFAAGSAIYMVAELNSAGLADVVVRVIKCTTAGVLSDFATPAVTEVTTGVTAGWYQFTFTPDAAGFYFWRARSASVGKYVGGVVPVTVGMLADGTSGLVALNTDLDALLTRLSAARAGYLDNLSVGAVALEATLTAIKGGGWTTETLFTIAANLVKVLKASYIIDGAVVTDAGNSATQVKTDLANSTNDFYNSTLIVFTSGTYIGQCRKVTDYIGSSKIIYFDALAGTPAIADTFQIVPDYLAAAGGGGDATAANQTAILADIGDASASTLGSLYAILGNPATTITAQIVAHKAATDATALENDVPTADVATNVHIRDAVGNKEDAAVTVVGTTKTIIAYVKGLINQIIAVKAKTDLLPASPADGDELHVQTADSTANVLERDVIGQKSDAAQTVVGTTRSLMGYIKGIVNTVNALSAGSGALVNDFVVYLAAEDLGATEIADDGSSPSYLAEVSQTNATEGAAEAAPAWTEDYNLEQALTLNLLSVFAELEIALKMTGAGTAYAKFQMRNSSVAAWVDVTDTVSTSSTVYTVLKRTGSILPFATITAGANQFQVRICMWNTGGTSAQVKLRSDSYVRITARRS